MIQFLDPNEMSDVVISEFDKAKYKAKIVEKKLKEIIEEQKKENSIQERIKKIKETLKKSRNKKEFLKRIKHVDRKSKNKRKRIQQLKAKATAEKLNQNQKAVKFSKENLFSVRLDINDYPENVRNKLCSMKLREMVKDLVGGSIQINRRGEYIISDRCCKPGIEKLHLIIQGENKTTVNLAKRELFRILNEATQQITERGGEKNT